MRFSTHLAVLRRAGLLADHEEGRFVICALSPDAEVRRLGAPSLCAAGFDLARLEIIATEGSA